MSGFYTALKEKSLCKKTELKLDDPRGLAETIAPQGSSSTIAAVSS